MRTHTLTHTHAHVHGLRNTNQYNVASADVHVRSYRFLAPNETAGIKAMVTVGMTMGVTVRVVTMGMAVGVVTMGMMVLVG